MPSATMNSIHRACCATRTFSRITGVIALGLTALAITSAPASANVLSPYPLQQQIRQDNPAIEVRARAGGAVRRTTVVGPRGGVASRTVVRGGAVVGPGAWVRPARYAWPRGGAIAAGAAIGFVTAATAAAWAGSPPAPGMCWYYTDPTRTQGFWDYCK